MKDMKIQGVIYAIIAALSFGFMPIFATYAYKSGSNAIMVVFLRNIFTMIYLFIILKIQGVSFKVDRSLFIQLGICGVVGSTGTALTLFISYEYISVGLATILHFIYPVVVTVVSFFMFNEELNRKKILALILSIVGVYILVGFNEISIHPIGIILAITSGLFYSFYILQIGNSRLKELDSRLLIMYISFFTAISTAIYGVMTDMLICTVNISFVLSMIALVIVTTTALITVTKAVCIIGSTNTSILGTLEPITSIVLGFLLLHEAITINTVLGSILILFSVYGIISGNMADKTKIEN